MLCRFGDQAHGFNMQLPRTYQTSLGKSCSRLKLNREDCIYPCPQDVDRQRSKGENIHIFSHQSFQVTLSSFLIRCNSSTLLDSHNPNQRQSLRYLYCHTSGTKDSKLLFDNTLEILFSSSLLLLCCLKVPSLIEAKPRGNSLTIWLLY